MIDLNILLERYPHCFTTKNQLAALLRDFYPKEKKDINLILTVYDSGIASRLSGIRNIDSQMMMIFVKQLADEYCLQEQYAVYGIEMWAKAYNLSLPETETVITTTELHTAPLKKQTVSPVKPEPPVSCDSLDYEITDNGNGYIIAKFHGTEAKHTVIPDFIDGKRIIGIGSAAYENCTDIETLEISEGIQFIGDWAFFGCIKLRDVHFPSSLISIGRLAFFECNRLDTIILNEGLRTIGDKAFGFCEDLSRMLLPSTVTKIGENILGNFFNNNTVVYCYPDTYGLKYARKRGYPVESAYNFKK